jgi:hypothetical protein
MFFGTVFKMIKYGYTEIFDFHKDIGKWMGIYSEKHGMSHVYQSVSKHLFIHKEYEIYKNFEEFELNYLNISYPHLSGDKRIENFKEGNKSKYLVVNPQSFRKWMMRLKNDKGNEICEYFIALENLLRHYVSYQHASNQIIKDTECIKIKQQLTLKESEFEEKYKLKDLEIDKYKEREIKINALMMNLEPIKKEQIIYIATTLQYAKLNRFKVDGVKSRKELCNFQN